MKHMSVITANCGLGRQHNLTYPQIQGSALVRLFGSGIHSSSSQLLMKQSGGRNFVTTFQFCQESTTLSLAGSGSIRTTPKCSADSLRGGISSTAPWASCAMQLRQLRAASDP